jgi:hypothetical protein
MTRSTAGVVGAMSQTLSEEDSAASIAESCRARRRGASYLPALPRLLDTLVKSPLTLVPIELTAATITTEMPTAMSAYSIAVAASSSRQKRIRIDMQFSARVRLGRFPYDFEESLNARVQI